MSFLFPYPPRFETFCLLLLHIPFPSLSPLLSLAFISLHYPSLPSISRYHALVRSLATFHLFYFSSPYLSLSTLQPHRLQRHLTPPPIVRTNVDTSSNSSRQRNTCGRDYLKDDNPPVALAFPPSTHQSFPSTWGTPSISSLVGTPLPAYRSGFWIEECQSNYRYRVSRKGKMWKG